MGAPLGEQEVLLSKLGRMSVGKTGLEGQYEALLFGKPGTQEIEVNAAGQLIRILEKKPFESGETLKTTIYGELQTFVYNLLSAHKSGSAVVMNAQTGEVLAMVSYPSFDPHVFEDGILENEWRALLNDPYRPLTNKATSGLYAPGSVFKMIVALAALDAGIDPLKTHSCVGGVLVGNHMFHCHKPGGHGQMDLKSAITESCDVYFYEVAQKVGIEKIAQMALKFGLGAKTALDFPSEKEGLIPGKEWKQRVKKDSWKVYDTILSSIGQGYILSSPLQLAQLTARLATGKAITPRLTGENPIFESLDVLPVHLKIIQESMENVVNHPFGTGYASRLESVKYSGKTATSQVKRISMRERALNLHQSRSWGDKDHAIFTGYGPSESPKYVVAVVIEHGGSGSRIAAPIAGAIFKWLLEK
jgi:penicillin-binding protein 2